MKIIIPTKGRISNQTTLQNLPPALRDITQVVCPEKEAFWIEQKFPKVLVTKQPDPAMTIAEKRKWIVDSATDPNIVMLDDDLRFAVRRDDNPALFRKAEEADILRAFTELSQLLSPDVPHAGFSARGSGIGDAAKRGGWQEGKRMMYVLGYHVPTVKANAVFNRISTHEDMDICLQLLSKGFANMVNFSFVVDQKFGSPGGCSGERTIERNNADVELLAAYHPEYVRVTRKEYASSEPRLEVVCAWQKCLRDGKLRKQSDNVCS